MVGVIGFRVPGLGTAGVEVVRESGNIASLRVVRIVDSPWDRTRASGHGHELERSRICFVPGGFELDLAIPNEDPTTYSMWLVEGRNVDLL
jgi:hypothetical protein